MYWLIEPEMSASTTSGGWISRGERKRGRIMSPPVRRPARSMARASVRRPRGSGRKRRVRTRSKGSVSAAMARLASAISRAFICAKSLPRSTSLPDTVMRASISTSGISCGLRFLAWPSNMASATRLSAARGFCRSRVSGALGENMASIFSTSSRDFQNSRNASSKVA